jgi:hypothetical protein
MFQALLKSVISAESVAFFFETDLHFRDFFFCAVPFLDPIAIENYARKVKESLDRCVRILNGEIDPEK